LLSRLTPIEEIVRNRAIHLLFIASVERVVSIKHIMARRRRRDEPVLPVIGGRRRGTRKFGPVDQI